MQVSVARVSRHVPTETAGETRGGGALINGQGVGCGVMGKSGLGPNLPAL
jgi:hypothetical protein